MPTEPEVDRARPSLANPPSLRRMAAIVKFRMSTHENFGTYRRRAVAQFIAAIGGQGRQHREQRRAMSTVAPSGELEAECHRHWVVLSQHSDASQRRQITPKN